MSRERLQKLLARAGIASRRECETLISAGRVTVDGAVVRQLGTRADPEHQQIALDGQPIRFPPALTYIMLDKPSGVITSAHDPEGRPTVLDLVHCGVRVVPVGRLDWDTEGLLLLTDDGELAHRLTHPRFHIDKEYLVWTSPPTSEQVHRLAGGILLDGVWTAPARVEDLEWPDPISEGSIVSITIREGRNRQVRRMFAAVDLPVYRLCRVRLGPLHLSGVASGEWRHLHPKEVGWLLDMTALGHAQDRVHS